MNQIKKTTPFVKWIGGKKQFLSYLDTIVPKQYNTYIEPFVGGGSLFFHLQPKKAVIGDINRELITAYLMIKSRPNELINLLEEYKQNHSKEFHAQMKLIKPKNELEIAGRFIYLNKSSFNGLYRLNSKGEFNAGFNKQESITLFEKDNILAISEYLRNNQVEIYFRSYENFLPSIKKGDFVFCDPPYDSEENNSFNSYSTSKFTKENQKQLFHFLKECEKKGAKWLLTNHATTFIKELYQGYPQVIKSAYRMVNSKGNERGLGVAQEIFITNYSLSPQIEETIIDLPKVKQKVEKTNLNYCKTCKNSSSNCIGCNCAECSIMKGGKEN